ncbi:hypothetical protein AA106555_1432 [Neokomagataea thailandica NBRC 106555]|uniref:YbaK/EbsC family protein n=2 Tax=Neokomagataea TaxID=1223423 RepID=A0A4Y6V7V2_9PROT|nr:MULTISPECIES: YbaK/EbsC family protein [Neokomagataea]QDH24711.1 YbaK/EbsC family protein [Neokomagataea tanensis]GBR53775.1 hypothetical protein AA106555_1432 [Neokomagataea thailandica NBRC 106555]
MSFESVIQDLAVRAKDLAPIQTALSSATVEDAAKALNVKPDQIAKTLGVKIGTGETAQTVLIVMAGTRRLDNRLTREALGGKPRFLNGEDVEALTSHPPGGVCPFGLKTPLAIYCDRSLTAHEFVYPAAGSRNASLKITPEHLGVLTGENWVDVTQPLLSLAEASSP